MANIDVTQVTLNSSPADDVGLLAVNGLEIQRVPVSSIKNNSSGSGSGGGIVTVETLPTENINENAIYKVNPSHKMVYFDENGTPCIDEYVDDLVHIYTVDELPEVGQPYLDLETEDMYFYYLEPENVVYLYLTEELVTAMQIPFPAGWVTYEDTAESMGQEFSGCIVVKSLSEIGSDRDENAMYLLAEGASLHYHDGEDFAKIITSKDLNDGNSSGNTSGGTSTAGASIIYATELPSTPSQAIYVITEDEVVKVDFYQSQTLPPEIAYCEIVDALPEIGIPAMDLSTNTMYVYYLTTDGEIYGYVDAALEAAGGVPVGWYPVAPLFGAVDTTYGGQITSTDQATDASTMYALLTKQPKTRVYVPMPDGAFLELTSGIRTRFDEINGTVSITEM